MKSVEVDARGLNGQMLAAILRRACSLSGGNPVIATVDGETEADEASCLAGKLRRKCLSQPLEGGSVRIELTR